MPKKHAAYPTRRLSRSERRRRRRAARRNKWRIDPGNHIPLVYLPLVQGGEGRTDSETTDAASLVTAALAIALALALAAIFAMAIR